MKIISCLLAVVVLAIPPEHTVALETPPAGEPARDFQLPKITRLTLDNGLKITLVPFGKIPKVSIRVDVRTGNANEGEHTWLSDLAGELMKEGTQTRSASLINRQTARMGGQLGISTGLDLTVFGISVLSEFAEDALTLVAETIRQPAFPASELERLRANLLRQRSLSLSQPQAIARAAFSELLYPHHAYGRAYPGEEQLQSYTLAAVVNYYGDNFGARRSHILVGGQFDKDKVLAAIKKAFGSWPSGPPVLVDPPASANAPRIKLINKPGASQSNVYIGLSVMPPAAPDFIAFAQMNTLLGGYFSSRITANLREDKGYTYSPRSRLSTYVNTANWAQVAAITTEHTGAAITEIFAEIERLKETPPSAEEVERTQSYQSGTFVLQHATPGGLLNRLSYMALHGLPDVYLTNYLSNISKISPMDLQTAARRYLHTGNMTVVIVGDLEKVRPQLELVTYLRGYPQL